MEITATIEKVTYKPFLSDSLEEINIENLDINQSPTSFLLKEGDSLFSVSKWVSPKRTRSYPYERVYNTLKGNKKLTIIPIIKDEGQKGDRDYIQWDTVSLMSLLDVYVIFAYYKKAQKNHIGDKITNQEFDNNYVIDKIKNIKTFHSSALHWNLAQITDEFGALVNIAKSEYSQIEIETGVKLHSAKGIERFAKKIEKDVHSFKEFSREKAEQAQKREIQTIQPKEFLSTSTKAKITIKNYLGGAYFFTVDEVKKDGEVTLLIECKHTKNALLPSKSDIKDGLLKLILYKNLVVYKSR